MLRAIAIRRLRGIKEGLVEDLKQVNVLVGRNGAGKSTILEAVYLASACAQQRDPLRPIDKLDYVIMRRGGRGNWENARRTLWYMAEVEKPIEIVLHVQSPEGVKEYEFHVDFETDRPLAFPVLLKDRETEFDVDLEDDMVCCLAGQWIRRITAEAIIAKDMRRVEKLLIEDFFHSLRRLEKVKKVEDKEAAKELLDYLSRLLRAEEVVDRYVTTPDYDRLKAFLAKDYNSLKTLLSNVLLIDNRLLTNYLQSLEKSFWGDVIMRRHDKELAKLVSSVLFTNVEGFSYIPTPSGEFQLFAMLPLGSIRVEDLGDGVLRGLYMSVIAFAAKPSVLLLEEPEIQLHPGGLLKFMKFMLKLAKEKNFQVIMTTHSAEAVSIIANACTSPELGIECSIKYVEREDGILKVENLDPEDLKALKRLRLDVRYLGVL